jgi:hypothetical protein
MTIKAINVGCTTTMEILVSVELQKFIIFLKSSPPQALKNSGYWPEHLYTIVVNNP